MEVDSGAAFSFTLLNSEQGRKCCDLGFDKSFSFPVWLCGARSWLEFCDFTGIMEVDERILLLYVVFQKIRYEVNMKALDEKFWKGTTKAVNFHCQTSFTVMDVRERFRQLEIEYRAGRAVKYPKAYAELFGPARPNLKIVAVKIVAAARAFALGLLLFKANGHKFVRGKAENQQELESHDSLIDEDHYTSEAEAETGAEVEAEKAIIHLEWEKKKEDMLGKLKDAGNAILGRFGINVDNFKAVEDQNPGFCSISSETDRHH